MWQPKDMNDYLDGKVYTNYFADIAPMILATATNTVLNNIDVDKKRQQECSKPKSNQDQIRINKFIVKFTYTGRITMHDSAMAAYQENHISSELLKSVMKNHISSNADINKIPIKTNKRSDNIVIKLIMRKA